MNYLNRISTKKSTPRYITVKLLKVKYQEKILKAEENKDTLHTEEQ